MKAQLGISEQNTAKVAKELARLLADETVLYIKTKNAHWNIEDPAFFSLHTFFAGQITQLDNIIDSVAERIRSLGHYAPATLGVYLHLTQLTE